MSTEGVTDLATFVAYVQGLAREVGNDPSRCTNNTVPHFSRPSRRGPKTPTATTPTGVNPSPLWGAGRASLTC